MLDALWTSASGMLAQQTALDVIANNLANVNTVGFKSGRTAFQDLLYNTITPQNGSAQGNQMGLGVSVSAVQAQFADGSAQTTGVPTDLRIAGPGFLQALQSDGSIVYTRAGNLDFDGQGQLVTANGSLVLDRNSKPIVLPPGANRSTLSIGQDGTITIDGANGKPQTVAQIGLAVFPNPAGLEAAGATAYTQSVNSGTPQIVAAASAQGGTINAGQLEMSNVNSVDEMVNMITTQRSFEAVSKVVQASDEMLQDANSLRR
jgi:flagellar basal-body rod protein FlgG